MHEITLKKFDPVSQVWKKINVRLATEKELNEYLQNLEAFPLRDGWEVETN